MEKNKEYNGKVLSLGTEGEGIIKCGDTCVFVPFCLAGEEVSFTALKSSGGIAYGKLTEVATLSPDRVTPVCPAFGKCGGCQLQHASYSCQLSFKRELVKNCLKKIGGLDAEVGETVRGEKVYGYRNKLVLPVGVDSNGATAVGFYAARSHRIVPVSECALQAEWSKKLISALKTFMSQCALSGYDENTKRGDIRHIVAREVKEKLIITLVAARYIDTQPFIDLIKKSLGDFTLWLNVNNSAGNAVFGGKWRLDYGNGFFCGEDCGIKFKAGANTFLQVNDDVRAKLYAAAVEAAADERAVAVDLYSGGGMLTAMLAKSCRAAYGVEIVPEAVACADELKRLNLLEDKMFNICGAVEDQIKNVFAKTAGYKRVIVCDPPRKGMERSVVDAVIKSGAEKVVLISCNPATLARDLGLLCGSLTELDGQLIKTERISGAKDKDSETGAGGADGRCGAYRIDSITPFDMFPQTKHVETLVVLSLAKG